MLYKASFGNIDTIKTGRIKNSPHKRNKYYLQIENTFIHLTTSETLAIINCLAYILWDNEAFTNKQRIYRGDKWQTLKELNKDIKKINSGKSKKN